MVISQPPGNNPSYYYRAFLTNAASIVGMLPETPYVLYMQLQHQGNSEMVLLSIFFTRIRSTEGSSAGLFFIHFVAPCACSSSSVNIT